MSMERTGGCLCGAVRFSARAVPSTVDVCHCEMCRRWTGSSLIEVDVAKDQIDWTGQDKIAKRQSSEWAERAWCSECGSGLWFSMSDDSSEWGGTYAIPLGLFDDPNGFEMRAEIYIDHKPDSYAYTVNDRKVLTRADCVAKFPALGEA